MKPEELNDDIIAHLDNFDTAYVDFVATTMDVMSPEEWSAYLADFRKKWMDVPKDEAQIARNEKFQRLNVGLAKNATYVGMLRRHAEEAAATPAVDETPVPPGKTIATSLPKIVHAIATLLNKGRYNVRTACGIAMRTTPNIDDHKNAGPVTCPDCMKAMPAP